MKYKIAIAVCVFVFISGLSCLSTIPQAKSTEDEVTENEIPLETNIDNKSEEENFINNFWAGGGLTPYLSISESEYAEYAVQAERIAVQDETSLTEDEESTDAEPPVQEDSEYADFAIANVNNYVNVRTEPNTNSKIVGKIYHGAVAQILSVTEGEDGEWFQVVSGNVEGYVKAEFFFYGDDAVAVIDDYVTRYATVQATRLNVRSQPDIESSRIGYINNGERVQMLENQGEWLKVQYTENSTGFVSAEYVTVSEEFVYAKTLEEEAQERAERQALLERQRQEAAAAASAAENTELASAFAENTEIPITVTSPETTYSTNEELRQQIVDYAMQFLGNQYIHGGRTLAGGTDCSGFTSLIYADFGYSLGRTPASQLSSAGRGIDYSEIQPGDIICYGSGGKCTHVALYIGDGQIIHSANPRKGVIITRADYDTILGVRNVID